MEVSLMPGTFNVNWKHLLIAFLLLIGFIVCVKTLRTPFIRSSYDYQENYKKYTKNAPVLRVAIVSDLDTASKDGKVWRALVMTGTIFKQGDLYDFSKDGEFNVTSAINEKGRGMELSELLNYKGVLYGFDDRTGLVCEIDMKQKKSFPRHILMDGDLKSEKGMKIEWATVYKDKMVIGSIGKEFTTPTGEYLNDNPLFVKTIDTNGKVEAFNWKDKYHALKKAVGIEGDGYFINEAVTYAASKNKWYFAPRKCSNERYDDTKDETRACKYIISTSDFSTFDVLNDPQHDLSKGFSSIKVL
ncbi:apyrase, putative, partial [Entamoeba invadens IP1]